MKLHRINTGLFKLDGGAMFGVVPKTIWNKINPADANNLCTWAMRCLLIEDKDRLMLIDTGIGDKQEPSFFKHYFLHGNDSLKGSIQKAGFSPEDITDVLLTHLHFDHCGGATVYNADRTKIETTFKNAHYWTSKKHWDWATHPNPREKASFLKENLQPLEESGQLHFVEEGFAFENMDLIYVNGHTESQILPLINYKNKKILYAADLIPSLGHLKIPYVMSYDVRPLVTMEEKQKILNRVVDEKISLFFEHDPIVETAMLTKAEKGFVAEGRTLKDFLETAV